MNADVYAGVGHVVSSAGHTFRSVQTCTNWRMNVLTSEVLRMKESSKKELTQRLERMRLAEDGVYLALPPAFPPLA